MQKQQDPARRDESHPERHRRCYRHTEQAQVERKGVGVGEAGENPRPECGADWHRRPFDPGEEIAAAHRGTQRPHSQPAEKERSHDADRAGHTRRAFEQQVRPADRKRQPGEVPDRDAEDGEQRRAAAIGERKPGDDERVRTGAHDRRQVDREDGPEERQIGVHA
jgi:hypothetical protein